MSVMDDDIRYLLDYWTKANGTLAGAQGAMSRLIAAAAISPPVRQAFAVNSIFETAMIVDQTRSDVLMAQNAVLFTYTGIEAVFGERYEHRTPRQLMLDGIYDVATGGWWGYKDPSGVTKWLRSVDVSAGAVAGTLKGDPSPDVRAAMLKILRDVAIPEYWASFLKTSRVFETLDSQLPTTQWNKYDTIADLAARKVLQSLSASAQGRVEADLAQYAMTQLPTFPTGDGKQAATLPPAKTPWYRSLKTLSATAIGLVSGAYAAHRRSR